MQKLEIIKQETSCLFETLGRNLNPKHAEADLKEIMRMKSIRQRAKARCSNATDQELQREAIFGI